MRNNFIFARHTADLAESTPGAQFACWCLAHQASSSSRLYDHKIASEVVSMRPAKADIMGSSCRISKARPICRSIEARVTFMRCSAWMRTYAPRSMTSISVPGLSSSMAAIIASISSDMRRTGPTAFFTALLPSRPSRRRRSAAARCQLRQPLHLETGRVPGSVLPCPRPWLVGACPPHGAPLWQLLPAWYLYPGQRPTESRSHRHTWHSWVHALDHPYSPPYYPTPPPAFPY